MTICISGSVAYDTIFSFSGLFRDQIIKSRLEHISMCFPASAMTRRFGGCGGNIAYACRVLRDDPVLLSAAGENDAADYIEHLRTCGIRSAITMVANEYTAQCFILTDSQGAQISSFCPNATLRARTDQWPENENFNIGILAPETREIMLARIRQFSAHKIPFFFDPGQVTPRFSAEELLGCFSAATYTVMSDYEFGLIQKITGATENTILKTGCKALIITHAESGSTVFTQDGKLTVKACSIKAVDAVGAGDAFRAGLLHAVSHHLGWEKALQLASAIASFKVETKGAQTYKPSAEAILNRLDENYGNATGFCL